MLVDYVRVYQAPPVEVAPDSILVTQGTYLSGGLSELAESDNMNFRIQRTSPNGTEFHVKGLSPVEHPTSLAITLEGSETSAHGEASQTVWLYNYQNPGWEEVDSRSAPVRGLNPP